MVRWTVAAVGLVVLAGCGRKTAPHQRPPVVAVRDAAPADATPPDPAALVDVAALDPTLIIDIRYATADNFTGKVVYPLARCRLRRAVAARLLRVQAALRARGLGLKLWDCYRPFSVQERFWALVPDARYVARPVRKDGAPVEGSKHNRGAAVDLTLVRADGSAVPMPTGYDDFTPRAHRGNRDVPAPARANAELLEQAMRAQGFAPLPTEWWHFDGPGWQDYPLADEPL